MAGLYGEAPQGVAFTLYDDIELSDKNALYNTRNTRGTGQSAATAIEYLVVAGHTWTLSARTLESFEASFGRSAAPLIAAGGTGLSLLLSLLVWLMATGRARAIHLAESMTKDLRVAVQNTESALEAERQAVREQRNFLAMVSHEFRTPLSIIDSAAQMLKFNGSLEETADSGYTSSSRSSTCTAASCGWKSLRMPEQPLSFGCQPCRRGTSPADPLYVNRPAPTAPKNCR